MLIRVSWAFCLLINSAGSGDDLLVNVRSRSRNESSYCRACQLLSRLQQGCLLETRRTKNKSVAMGAKLQVSLLLATLPMLLWATATEDGRALVDEFYGRYNSSRPADLIFVLDRSGSVSRKLWVSMINFIKVVTLYVFSFIRYCTTENDTLRVSVCLSECL